MAGTEAPEPIILALWKAVIPVTLCMCAVSGGSRVIKAQQVTVFAAFLNFSMLCPAPSPMPPLLRELHGFWGRSGHHCADYPFEVL